MSHDSTPVRVLYSNEELRQSILMIIERCGATGITVVELCYQIVQIAIQDHMVKNVDENATITAEELAFEEQLRVYRILGELTEEHEISILSEQAGLSDSENRFVKYSEISAEPDDENDIETPVEPGDENDTEIPAEPGDENNTETPTEPSDGNDSEIPTEFSVGDINFQVLSIDDMTVEVAKNGDATGDIIIPGEVMYNNLTFRVVGIGERAFANNQEIVSVSLPNTITYIDDFAFNKLSIPMALPLSLEKVGEFAFAYNTFEDLSLPSGLKEIADSAFAHTTVKSGEVAIPASVIDMEGNVFYSSEMSDIVVDAKNGCFESKRGVLFSKDGLKLITYPSLKTDLVYTIPTGVTTIGSCSFVDIEYLTKLVVPETVNRLEENALESCPNLKTIVMRSETPPTVEDDALDNVEDSCIIFVPKGCAKKYKVAAGWKEKASCIVEIPTEFTEAKINYKVLSLDDMTVEVAKNTKVSGAITIPVKVNYQALAFDVVGMEGNPFSDAKLKEIKVEDGHEYFKHEHGVLFSKDGKKIIAYPNLKADNTYTIPGGVTTMGSYSFGNGNLTKMVIPATVEQLEPYALWSCGGLETLEVQGTTPPKVGEKALNGIPAGCIIIVPKKCVSKYKAADGWKVFADRIVDGIPTEFTEAKINYKVLSLDDMTVEVVKSPSVSGTITIPAKVNYQALAFDVVGMEGNPFSDAKLKEIKVEDGHEYFKHEHGVLFSKDGKKIIAYPNLKADNTYTVPGGVTTMGSYSFGNGNLTKMVIPATVEQLEPYALWSCRGLKTLEVQGTTPPKVGEKALNGIPAGCIIIVPKKCVSKYKAAEGWKVFANRIVDGIPTEFTEAKINYKVLSLDDMTVEVVKSQGASGAITIPIKVNYQALAFDVVGMEGNPFSDSKLKEIKVEDGHKYFKHEHGVLFSKDGKKIIAYPNLKADNTYTVPSGVTIIGKTSFANGSLTKLVIPDSVSTLEDRALFSCSNLQKIKVGSVTPPVVGKESLKGVKTNCFIIVPKGCVSKYKTASGWKDFASRIFDGEVLEEFTDNKIKYHVLSVDDMTVEVIKSPDVSSALVIPKEVPYCGVAFKVIRVGESAFSGNNRKFTEITFPDTIKSIGDCAFTGAFCQKAITLPKSLEEVGKNAFESSGLTFVNLDLPSGLKEIKTRAFAGVAVLTKKVTIPAGVSSLGNMGVFVGSVVEKIEVASGNANYKSIEGVLFSRNGEILIEYPNANTRVSYTVPAGVKVINNYAFYNCTKLKEITLPDTVSVICELGFLGATSLTLMEIKATTPPILNAPSLLGINCFILVPKGCATKYRQSPIWMLLPPALFVDDTQIQFSKDNIKYQVLSLVDRTVEVINSPDVSGAISIPASVSYLGLQFTVVSIGQKAFDNTDNKIKITSISLPNTIKSVGYMAFRNLAIPMTLPSSLEEVGSYAFEKNKFVDLKFTTKLRKIGIHAFYYATVETQKVTIPSSLDNIGWNSFCYTRIKEFVVDVNNTAYKSENGVLLSKDGKKLKAYPYLKQSANSTYTIPSSVTTILEYAFGVADLSHLVIPSTVETLEDYSLWFCPSNLKTLTVKRNTPPKVFSNSLKGVKNNNNCVVIVPKGHAADYQNAPVWKEFASRIVEESSQPEFTLSNIKYKVLSFVDRTVEVAKNPNASGAITIPSNVSYLGFQFTVVGIGAEAFHNSKITSISLPNTIKSVGYYAFYGLKIPMSLPSSLEKVGMRAFRDNTFEDLSLPSGLKEIGRLAFEFATVKSQRATIRSSVTAIAGNVFYVSVKEIKVSDSNPAYKSINGVLFSKDGRKLTAYPYVKPDTVYSIPSGVTTIESDQIIASLTRLVIPASVNKLEACALWSLYNLKTLELQGTTPPVVGDQSLHGVKSSCVIIVPKGCAAKYKAASGWKNFASQIREA